MTLHLAHLDETALRKLQLEFPALDVEQIYRTLLHPDGLFSQVTSTDYDSLCHSPTPLASKLLAEAKRWIPAGPHSFWAGRAARQRACLTPYAESHVPFMSFLFIWCQRYIKKNKSDSVKLLFFTISRLFARTTIGLASVFLSSDKPSEEPGLTVGTNFWEAELPVLWTLQKQGTVQVLIYMGGWKKAVALSSVNLKSIPIYRRYAHSLDRKDCRDSFVSDDFTQMDYDAWRTQPPRRGILVGKLHGFACQWKLKSQNKKSQKHKEKILSGL